MDRKIVIGVIAVMLVLQVVIVLNVLPAYHAAPTPAPRVLGTPSSGTTNFTNINADEIDGNTVNVATTLSVAGTPVVWATPQPTPTANGNKYDKTGGTISGNAFITGTLGVTGAITTAGSIAINATPVFWATPQTLFVGSVAKRAQECGVVSVTNSATFTPVTTNLTPIAAIASLNQAATGDAAHTSTSFSGNVITLAVIGTNTTPTANTTPASVAYCLFGSTP